MLEPSRFSLVEARRLLSVFTLPITTEEKLVGKQPCCEWRIKKSCVGGPSYVHPKHTLRAFSSPTGIPPRKEPSPPDSTTWSFSSEPQNTDNLSDCFLNFPKNDAKNRHHPRCKGERFILYIQCMSLSPAERAALEGRYHHF